MTRWFRREINLGDTGPDVDWIRRKLVMHPGKGDPVDFAFQAHVRAFQFAHHLPTTGVVDEATADALGEPAYLPRPDWWRGPLHHHDPGYADYLREIGCEDVYAVRRLRNALGLPMGDEVDDNLMDALSLWAHA
jgi:hypothetical protein